MHRDGIQGLDLITGHVGNDDVLSYFRRPKHKSGRNKGFGFTTFETEEELERVLEVSM
jgi:hypothetical protein